MVDIKHRFGDKVRQTRKQKNISQEELAFKAGLHRTYISDVERGGKAKLLKGSLEDLWNEAQKG